MKIYANKMENMTGMDAFLQKHHLQKLNRKEIDNTKKCCSSVPFCHSVVSDSLLPHEPQHARPPCPSSTPRVHPNRYPWSRLCHPTISSSIVPFCSCPQTHPASGSFPMSWLFAMGRHNIGLSALNQSLQSLKGCSINLCLFFPVLHIGLSLTSF